MLYVLALSRSAFVIRHWFEINLDDASMEHGVRVELREMPAQPHRGTESAAQVVMLDRPLWRADLFDRLAEAPGAFGAAHFHPRFDGNEPCARVWDARLTADPWGWLGDQVANAGAVSGHGPWPGQSRGRRRDPGAGWYGRGRGPAVRGKPVRVGGGLLPADPGRAGHRSANDRHAHKPRSARHRLGSSVDRLTL
jgi:hypothetical protein